MAGDEIMCFSSSSWITDSCPSGLDPRPTWREASVMGKSIIECLTKVISLGYHGKRKRIEVYAFCSKGVRMAFCPICVLFINNRGVDNW
jgi:hypothetical protein